jgi:hypothetical protein
VAHRERRACLYGSVGDRRVRPVVMNTKLQDLSPPDGAHSVTVVTTRRVCGIPLWEKGETVSYS